MKRENPFIANVFNSSLSIVLLFSLFTFTVQSQSIVGLDNAYNYYSNITDGNNEGFGFGNWNFYRSGGGGDADAGWFIGNSTADGHGDINIENVSFGLYGNNSIYANAERTIDQWGDGYVFKITLATQLRNGGRGLSLFNSNGFTPGDELFNFDVSNSGYDVTGWSYQSDMILDFEITQNGTNLDITITGTSVLSSWSDIYTTTVTGTLGGFKLYTGNNTGIEGERDLYFNNLQIIAPPNNATIPGSISIRSILIPNGYFLNMGNNDALITEGGVFENNGDFNAGTGTVSFEDNSVVRGSSVTTFYNAEIINALSDGVDFGTGKSSISNSLLITSGFVNTNAPGYLTGATLVYQTGGSYTRAIEWNNPWAVQVSNSTTLNLDISAFNANLSQQGDLTIDANSIVNVDNNHNFDFIIGGNLFINGTLNLQSTGSGSGFSDLFLEGDFFENASTGDFNPNNREVIFSGSSIQNINSTTVFDFLKIENISEKVILSESITVNSRVIVENGASLDFGSNFISGNGNFTLNTGGTLVTSNAEGYSSNVSTGSLQLGGNIILPDTANYHFTGKALVCYSGDLLPTTISGNILLETQNEFRFNTTEKIVLNTPGSLIIHSGQLIEDLSPSQGRQIEGTGNLEMNGGEYIIQSTFSSSTDITLPRLSGTYNLSDGIIHLSGASNFQVLQGGRTYSNITFSGAGTKQISSSTTDVNGTVLIENDAIVDLESFALGDASTNLTMTGGRLISKRTGTFPTMSGDYNLTGGVVEFANTNATPQTVRGPKSYFNIEITGTNVSNSVGNIEIISGGRFSIEEDALFRISNVAITGDGTFENKDNSTLLYGNSSGITQVGTNSGNIRTKFRIYSNNANYGFTGSQTQESGNGLPATVRGLILDKSDPDNLVTLTNSVEVTNLLELNTGKLLTGSNEIFLSSTLPSALIQGSSNSDFINSYIIGNLKRAVSQEQVDYVFPVGRDVSVQTATVNFNSGGLTGTGVLSLSASFETIIPSDYYGNIPEIIDDMNIDKLSGEGFWIINQENITTAQYSLSLHARTISGINSPSDIRILKRDSPSVDWEMAGNTSSFSGSMDNYTFFHQNINGFSEFALGGNSSSNPLPVEFLFFSAMPETNDVLLRWATATEINNDYFTILRSKNGIEFQEIAHLSGAGNSNSRTDYSYTDKNLTAGTYYYKIRQTDFDLSFDHSDVISVSIADYLSHFRYFYDHLTADFVFIFPYQYAVSVPYKIIDMQGSICYSGKFEHFPGGQLRIKKQILKNNGFYFIQLDTPSGFITRKLFTGF